MEPIGLCGGGAVALALVLTAVVGSALLAGGVALALARLGVTVDAWLKRDADPQPGESGGAAAATRPEKGATSAAPREDRPGQRTP